MLIVNMIQSLKLKEVNVGKKASQVSLKLALSAAIINVKSA